MALLSQSTVEGRSKKQKKQRGEMCSRSAPFKTVGKPQHCFMLVSHTAYAYSMPVLALQMAVSPASGDTASRDR